MIKARQAPRVGDDTAMATAGILHKMLIAICALVTLVFSFLFILPQFTPRWLGSIVAIYLPSFLLFVLNRRGKTRLASMLLVGGFWIVVSVLAYTANGIHSVAVVVFIIIIFIAGILLGAKAGFVTALVVTLTNLALTLLELSGALPPPSVEHSPLALWIVHTIFGLIVVYLQFIATESIGTGLRKAKEELEEREKAERALRESENRYRALVENSPDAIVVQQDEKIMYINSRAVSMLKLQQRSHAIGRPIDDFVPLEYRNMLAARWKQILSSGIPVPMAEWKLLCTDGSVLDVEGMGVPISFGGAPAILSTIRDITVRKKAEAELMSAKEFAENLIRTADAIVVGLDTHGHIRIFNNAAERITGYSKVELEGRNWFEQIVPRDRYPQVWEVFQRLPKGELPGEFGNPILTKGGEERFIVWRNSELREGGTITGSVSFGIDVTNQKRVEAALRQSESRLRQVIDLVPHFVFAKNRKGQFILVNKAVADAYGTSVDELLGKTDADFNPNLEEVEHFLRDDIEVMDIGRPKDIPEEMITDAAGRTRFLHTIKIPYKIASGREDAVLGVSTDITERKLAENTLRESEEQFRSLAEQSPNMIFINQAGRVVYANQRCEELMGYLRPELMDPAFDFRRLIHPDSLPAIQSSFARHAMGEEVQPYEYGLLTKAGKRIDAIITTKLVHHKNAPAILGIVTDISARKKSETELLFSRQQLRDLSNRLQEIREEESRRIAREIHDELGQTLTALKMDLASLDERTAEPVGSPDVAGKLTSMSTLVDSAIKSVRKIGSELRPVALDSLGLVAAIEWLAGDFMMRTGIHCTWTLPQEDLEIDRERSTAIFRILQESLTNIARHSGATDVRIFFESAGGVLNLRIEDNGRGMDVADRRRAGSFGILGMRERASLFGGRVSIESSPGKGTVLSAVVPLDDALRPATLFPGPTTPTG